MCYSEEQDKSPVRKSIEDVEFETDVLQETAIIIPTAKNNKFIVENGKKKFLVSLSPMKCICFYYSWYGKKCKHVNLVERIKFPKNPPEVLAIAKTTRRKKKELATQRKKKVPNTTRKAGRKQKNHFCEKKIIAKKLAEAVRRKNPMQAQSFRRRLHKV